MLKQAEDGTPVAEVCRKAGIAEATFYNFRKRYAGLMPSEVSQRICTRIGRGRSPTVVTTAVARDLSGFAWAIARQAEITGA